MNNILVTGGAGYIGSFMTKRLLDEGISVVVVDSLERGNIHSVDNRAKLETGNILDTNFLDRVFIENKFDAVIHFAGLISVGESSRQPDKYFQNNTFGSFVLLEKMKLHGVNKIVFSSTAAVYGNPKKVPIPEDHPKFPESPYGESKLLVESGLDWYGKTFGINSVSLRYFNAAGAALDGSIGEQHPEETHIIPNIIKAVMENREFSLFGNDYVTKDGTCVRDYIHVLDLVEAHMLALKKLENDKGVYVYNVGSGIGYSNRQVIAAVELNFGSKILLKIMPKRPGDSAVLVADNSKIVNKLNFKPAYSQLDTIIQTAILWHKGKFTPLHSDLK